MKDILQSKKTRAALLILGAAVAALVVFGLGLVVGYRKALFSSAWGMNYYRNFYGEPHAGPAGQMLGRMPLNSHGVSGQVLETSSSTISVKDGVGNEETVAVASDTVIREMSETISIANIKQGDQVTAIGVPNSEGQVEASFIRVFSALSGLPMMPGQLLN